MLNTGLKVKQSRIFFKVLHFLRSCVDVFQQFLKHLVVIVYSKRINLLKINHFQMEESLSEFVYNGLVTATKGKVMNFR